MILFGVWVSLRFQNDPLDLTTHHPVIAETDRAAMHLSMQRLVLQAQSPRKPGLINLGLENGWKDVFQPLNSLQHVSSSMIVDPKWDECSIDADGVKHPWPMESLDST